MFLVVVVLVLASACGDPVEPGGESTTTPTSVASPTTVMEESTTVTAEPVVTTTTTMPLSGPLGDPVEAACSVGGQPRFALTFLDGPHLTAEEFIQTEVGAELDTFFTEGPGAPEGFMYRDADGFSQVSETLVLGYANGAIISHFEVDDPVGGWGTCTPTYVSGDLVAGRWYPATAALDPDALVVPIEVGGGACVLEGGVEPVTEVIEIQVSEYEDRIEVIAWTRDEQLDTACPGIGISLEAEIELSAALGNRQLLDASTIPATVIDR
jgi:hypothetical protein